MPESGSDWINKEKELSIVDSIKPYLAIASPYSVWNPEIMDFRVGEVTRTLTAGEIENRYLQGKYPPSDMFILRAIHCLGYSNSYAIEKLLQYWLKRDGEKAGTAKRETLCIPTGIGRLRGRIESLCRNGVVICHEFYINQQYRKLDESRQYLKLYSVTGIGASMYRTALQENSVTYDLRDRFLSEDEIFRRAMCAIMTTSLLDSPYLSKVRFSYRKTVGRRKINVFALLEMKAGEVGRECLLVVEAVTVKTNPRVITSEERINAVCNRIEELKCFLDESMREVLTYILICAEDAAGIDIVRRCIEQVDPEMFQYCLITTGTVLEAKQTIIKPERLSESFLEFVRVGNSIRLKGATGYYFLA